MRSSGSGSGEKRRNFERYDYSRGIGYWYFEGRRNDKRQICIKLVLYDEYIYSILSILADFFLLPINSYPPLQYPIIIIYCQYLGTVLRVDSVDRRSPGGDINRNTAVKLNQAAVKLLNSEVIVRAVRLRADRAGRGRHSRVA